VEGANERERERQRERQRERERERALEYLEIFAKTKIVETKIRLELTSYCGVGSRITDGANLHDFSNGTLLMPFLEYIVDISYILQPRDLIRP